ncbi:ribosomal protection-like ABC-F family protein [Paenibacillus sp. D51F]
MIIVNAQNVRKYHAAHLVLDGAAFQIQDGEKVGLIGRNGSGKSTLLRLISGREHADEGMLTVRRDARIGYLPQIPEAYESMTVYEVLASGFGSLMKAKEELAGLESRMADPALTPSALERLLVRYSEVQEMFEQGGGYDMDTFIDQVASGLQIDRSRDGRTLGSLSGGEKTRVVLASQLVTRPDLLLLDEPTNHLDLKGMEWLEQFLRGYAGCCVIVSHDRYFLDAVGTKMIELEDGEAHTYLSDYSGYLKQKEELLLRQFAEFQEQQKAIKKMKETIRKLEEWGRIGDNEKFFKRAASIRKALDKMEAVKRPVLEPKTAEFSLNPQDRSGKQVIAFERVSKRYGDRILLQGAEGKLLYGEKAVLIGDNGSGKTTLLEMLLGRESADEGELKLGTRLEIGYLAQQEPAAEPEKSVLDYFRTEAGMEEGEARHLLARYQFYGAAVFRPLKALSGGEWSRLRLALLVRKRPNLLLLDEPTNHLDTASREALEEALEEFPGTILAVSHDRYFINRIAGRVWELSGGRIVSWNGNYDGYKAEQVKLQAASDLFREDKAPHRGEGAAPQVKPTLSGERMAAKSGSKENGKKTEQLAKQKEQLEKDIALLEARIAAAAAELELLAVNGSPAELEKRWKEREMNEQQLAGLMDRWLELAGE